MTRYRTIVGSPGVETVAATTDSALARAPRTPFELGRASTRTADPVTADDACPTCLTALDDCGFCSCCGRVYA